MAGAVRFLRGPRHNPYPAFRRRLDHLLPLPEESAQREVRAQPRRHLRYLSGERDTGGPHVHYGRRAIHPAQAGPARRGRGILPRPYAGTWLGGRIHPEFRMHDPNRFKAREREGDAAVGPQIRKVSDMKVKRGRLMPAER